MLNIPIFDSHVERRLPKVVRLENLGARAVLAKLGKDAEPLLLDRALVRCAPSTVDCDSPYTTAEEGSYDLRI